MNDNETEYQYDRCSSRGICAINPATASLLEVIIIYLKQISFYGLKLEETGVKDERICNLVLNTISILSSNYEISADNFSIINASFRIELPRVIKEYKKICNEQNITFTKAPDFVIPPKDAGINEYIKLGEKEFNKRIKSTPADILNLYRILFITIKSLCLNILVCKSYGINEGCSFVLQVLNLLNSPLEDKTELKKYILDAARKDCDLMIKIRNIQTEFYGEQEEATVSFSTTKGKAVLVVGSNLRELEYILEELKNKNIDIYTHDNMILAHTFPKFKSYKHLKGQYGQGMENCLLDFSTFPGPIILTKNSLFNVESLYRGRLFTTDIAYSKGVIQIKNNDLNEVIKSAENSKGFKKGKVCDSETIGFVFKEAKDKISKKLKNNKFKHIIIIGARGYSKEEEEYFNSFFKHLPENILAISLFCCEEKENILCFNSGHDNYAMIKISEYIIQNTNKKVSIVFPLCERHTLSIILSASSSSTNKIFVGNFKKNILKPNILEELKKDFGIKEISTPKQNLTEFDNP